MIDSIIGFSTKNVGLPACSSQQSLIIGVFVDVEGDKYLARIVKTFPPRSRASTSQDSAHPHALASDLTLSADELNDVDDPMKYFYNVRLIEKGSEDDLPLDYSSHGNQAAEDAETWGGSVMEVQADKIRYVTCRPHAVDL